MRDVLLEVLVDLLLVLLEGRELGDVVFRHYAVHLSLAELDDALAQIAQVLEQVVVVRIDEFPSKSQCLCNAQGETRLDSLPFEFRITALWPPRQEVVSPDVRVNAGIAGVVTEHTDTFGLAEFSALVIEILGCGQVLDLCPVLPRAELGGGEDDSMEPVMAELETARETVRRQTPTERYLSP